MSIPCSPIRNVLVKSKADAQPLSKTQKYFFLIIHVFFAVDFGFMKFKSPRSKIYVKLMSLTQCSFIFIYIALGLFNSNNNLFVLWYFIDILLFYVFSLSLIASKATYYDYQTDLHSFDAEINIDSSTYRLEYKIMIWFFINMLYRILMTLSFCLVYLEFCAISYKSLVLYSSAVIGLDTGIIIYTSVFYASYLRLKRFTSVVRNGGEDIISCQYLYKSLVENIERIKKTFDVVFILTLVTSTIDVTVTIYLPFAEQPEAQDPLNMNVPYAVVAQQLLMLFSPAFTAGLLTSQADKLRLVLYDMLIKDKTHTKEIRRFVAYVEGRPLRFKVWRVVPLDWRLPIIVINISVTYLIVMIQFTHKK